MVTLANRPKAVFCTTCSCPVPPHCWQVCGRVPGLAPVPLQVGHASTRGTSISLLTPKAASSKEIFMS